jgi:hypothetical protein
MALLLAVVFPTPLSAPQDPVAATPARADAAGSATGPTPATEDLAAPPDLLAPIETAPPTTEVVAAVPLASPAPVPRTEPWKLMLIGDSMAYTAALGLEPHASTYGFSIANEGIMGCGVVRGGPFRYFGAERNMEPRCEAWPSTWQEALDRRAPDAVAIFVGRWELMDRVHEGVWTNLFDPAFAAYLETELDNAIVLSQSRGSHVFLFSAPYYRRGLTASGGLFPEDDPARVDAVNALLRAVAARRGVTVVEVGAFLSPEGRYTADVDGMKVRSDGVHLTRQTGDLLAPWLFPQLQSALATG